MKRKFDYDLTVLIPMYNCESSISKTIQSVLNQIDEKYNVEILLIDDGSTDQTKEVCQKFTDSHDNVYYLYQNNAGVSSARNLGLDNAKGEYILFLDADDTLAPNTVNSIIEGFKLYETQTDVLVYPLYNVLDNGKKIPHIRNKNFNKVGKYAIYNLFDYPHLNQCTINTVIKNLPKSERIYFNLDLKQSEDALFNTTHILRSNTIVYVKGCGYEYHIGHTSTVDKFKSPVNIGTMLFDFFEGLIDISLKKSESVSRYTQSMILYELNWRFRQNTLYPHHLDEKEFNEWMDRLKGIFEHIEVETILGHPIMDYYHKIHFIDKFKNNIKYTKAGNLITFYSNEEVIFRVEAATIVFDKIRKENECLHCQGYVKLPLLGKFKDVNLIIENEDGLIEVPLRETAASYYKMREKVADFMAFDIKLPLMINQTYTWKLFLDDQEIITNIYFDKNVIFPFKYKKAYFEKEKLVVSYDAKPIKFHIQSLDQNSEKEKYNTFIKEKAGKNTLRFQYIKNFLDKRYKNKRIWLYNDRQGVKDNAYLQIKNDLDKNDKIEKYYVVRKGDENIIDLPKKNIVIFGSFKHKILYFYSELILTSFKDFIEYSPLSYDAETIFYNSSKRRVVYLQHGVLNAHTPWLYGKHVTKFDKFLISSHFERENLINQYGYIEDDLLEAGMIRLDSLAFDKNMRKRKILFAPSWRKGLVNEKSSVDRTLLLEDIVESSYYIGINNFINSEQLHELLEKQGYILDIKLHPIFLTETPIFTSESGCINIVQKNEDIDINEYTLFITDFSSFLFDFIKTQTRMAFFIPDYDYFLTGDHIYNRLDYDISKLGPLFNNEQQLIEFMEQNIINDFKIPEDIQMIYDNFYFSNKEISYGNQVYDKLIDYTEKFREL